MSMLMFTSHYWLQLVRKTLLIRPHEARSVMPQAAQDDESNSEMTDAIELARYPVNHNRPLDHHQVTFSDATPTTPNSKPDDDSVYNMSQAHAKASKEGFKSDSHSCAPSVRVISD